MSDISRRRFIGTAAGAAAVGAAAVATPTLVSASEDGAAPPPLSQTAVAMRGPVLAHVRDVSTGEIAVFAGTQEIVIRDRAVARTLVSAVKGS